MSFVFQDISYLKGLVSKNVEVVDPRLVKKTVVSIGLDLKLYTLSSTQISW